MRSATVFNFLIEATLMGSVMILLMLAVRKFLRPQLGSRLIRFVWLLVAVRLLVPLALPNPMVNEIRPTYSDNVGVRPIADQIRVRGMDAMDDMAYALGVREGSSVGNAIRNFSAETSYGHTARWLLLAYLLAAALVLGWMVIKNVRFMRRLRRDRVGPLMGEELTRYRLLCARRRVREIPVYWVDPLPSACLVGIIRPYIALPLSLKREELTPVLTHELCHKKAGDHWCNMIRNLCCVVHWFNPLVWLAAHLSRTDQEMACDERVTAPMNDEERIEYANTLALAAARRSAPGMAVLATGMTMKGRHIKERIRAIVDGRKIVAWLCVAALCVACAGTMLSFATAEYVAPLTMPSVQLMTGNRIDARPIANEAEASAYGVEILCGAFGLDASAAAVETQRRSVDQWTVSMAVNPEQSNEKVCYVIFDDDGEIWELIDSSVQNSTSGPIVHANPTYKTNAECSEPFYEYIRSFAALFMPDQPLDGMFIVSDYWCLDERFLSVRYDAEEKNQGCCFYLQIVPEVRIWGFERWDDEAQRERDEKESLRSEQASAQTRQENGEPNAVFLPMSAYEQGTPARNAAERILSSLTEVYSYSAEDADRFVYAMVEQNGVSYCLAHDPMLPEYNYVMEAERFTNMKSPYHLESTLKSESDLRYFFYIAQDAGWLQSWQDGDRRAFLETARDPLCEISFSDDLSARIEAGELSPAQAVEAAFEAYYGAPEMWGRSADAIAAWRDATLLRFGLAAQPFEL